MLQVICGRMDKLIEFLMNDLSVAVVLLISKGEYVIILAQMI